MPLNEIPKYFSRETRSLIDFALEQAWQELKKDAPVDVALARRKLAGTIAALASPIRRSLSGLRCTPPEVGRNPSRRAVADPNHENLRTNREDL